MPDKTLAVSLALLFLAAAAILSLYLLRSPPAGGQPVEAEFVLIDGRRLHLGQLRGRPVLVNFWATSCRLCIKEIPHLKALYRELAPRGLELIGVAMPYDPPDRVLIYARAQELPYPVALDVEGRVLRAFGGVRGTPTIFLVAPEGHVVLRATGKLDLPRLRRRIEKYLNPRRSL